MQGDYPAEYMQVMKLLPNQLWNATQAWIAYYRHYFHNMYFGSKNSGGICYMFTFTLKLSTILLHRNTEKCRCAKSFMYETLWRPLRCNLVFSHAIVSYSVLTMQWKRSQMKRHQQQWNSIFKGLNHKRNGIIDGYHWKSTSFYLTLKYNWFFI